MLKIDDIQRGGSQKSSVTSISMAGNNLKWYLCNNYIPNWQLEHNTATKYWYAVIRNAIATIMNGSYMEQLEMAQYRIVCGNINGSYGNK
jgi:transposase-like protein